MPAQRCVGWALPKAAERKSLPAERGRVLGSTSRTRPVPRACSLRLPAPPHAPAPPAQARLRRGMLAAAGLALCLTSPVFGCVMSAHVQRETKLSVFCPGDVSAPSVQCHLCPQLPSCASHPGGDHCLQALSPQRL